MFADDYAGGAEFTTEALIKASPYKVGRVKSRDVSMELLQQHVKKYWVFGNFSELKGQLVPTITANLNYSILEYDYKFCKYRSPEKHAEAEKHPCDCSNQVVGKLVSAFFYGAQSLFWMSQRQQELYHDKFPFLAERLNIVLSSVFDEETLESFAVPRPAITRHGWVVLGSNSWVKGFSAAEDWCKTTHKDYEVVWNIPYDQLLQKLGNAEGFVYLPAGGDTCPRMVIEAKMLGCELHLNDNVQHAQEAWFTGDWQITFDYLKSRPGVFWDTIRGFKDKKTTISGYTTTYNCVSQKYPFEESIRSMLAFCDEVVVVDGGSTDGTWEKLLDMVMEQKNITLASLSKENNEATVELSKAGASSEDGKIRIKQVTRDWNDPRFAVFDGQQKAEARQLCTKDFCWQMDSDEIVHEVHGEAIRALTEEFPKGVNLLALPVVEYWGGYDRVRMDVTPWKWRLSRNLPNITHGIPAALRKVDSDGRLYAAQGTDGCDMIDANTFEPIQFLGFYTGEAQGARVAALAGNEEARKMYEGWFNTVTENLPGVFHYSWFDIPRKIRTYKGYWGRHWKSLYDIVIEDTTENNMMFDKPWSEVTEDEMDHLGLRLATQTGGWVWHQKWTGQNVPYIRITKSPPAIMKNFYKDSK